MSSGFSHFLLGEVCLFFGFSHYHLNVPNSTLTETSHTACCHAEINKETTEVSVYRFKFMCSEIPEHTITRTRMKRERVPFLMMLFCGAMAANSARVRRRRLHRNTDFIQSPIYSPNCSRQSKTVMKCRFRVTQ